MESNRWITILGLIIVFVIALGFVFRTPEDSDEDIDMHETSSTSTQNTNANGEVAGSKTYSAQPEMDLDESKDYSAVITTTKGSMTIDLSEKDVPITVNNFVFLAKDGYYDNVIFHRIIKGFMVQTGDPTGTGAGSPGYSFEDEPFVGEYDRGVVAMANAGPDTNGSQFFIMHADYPLQANYTIFGKVTEGLDTLDAIANTPVTANMYGEVSTPTEKVSITSVKIIEK